MKRPLFTQSPARASSRLICAYLLAAALLAPWTAAWAADDATPARPPPCSIICNLCRGLVDERVHAVAIFFCSRFPPFSKRRNRPILRLLVVAPPVQPSADEDAPSQNHPPHKTAYATPPHSPPHTRNTNRSWAT